MKITVAVARQLTKVLAKGVKKKMERSVSMLCQASKDRFLAGPPRRGNRPIVRTGRLRDSLTWEVREDGIVGWYGSNRPWRGEESVYYGVFLELGFRHWQSGRFVGPYPFLRPPLIEKKSKLEKIWGSEEALPKTRMEIIVAR